jgi:formyltetrahydrofolate deformylase
MPDPLTVAAPDPSVATLAGPISGRLLVSCPDRPGIVAALAAVLLQHGANIVSSHQFSTEHGAGQFFMRLSFRGEGDGDREAFARSCAQVAQRWSMQWRITWEGTRKRVMLMASREDHCLSDLLWRHRRGELDMDLLGVISNHPDRRADVEALGVPYHHIPVTRETKPAAEAAQLALITGRADVVVLARYMQILSGDFLTRVGCPVINIHHSFLPAFAGAGPYERAFERGVKVIGATAHYVTEDLDEGPIIDQGVDRISHADTVSEMTRRGRDIERMTLASALRSHLDDRVIVHASRTIVF